jgi:hypothetical protein
VNDGAHVSFIGIDNVCIVPVRKGPFDIKEIDIKREEIKANLGGLLGGRGKP